MPARTAVTLFSSSRIIPCIYKDNRTALCCGIRRARTLALHLAAIVKHSDIGLHGMLYETPIRQVLEAEVAD
jgi:hypothetical protein